METNGKKYTIAYFPQPYINLMVEIDHPAHANLKAQLRILAARHEGKQNLGTYLKEIALHCNIIVEGLLTEEDQLRLMDILTDSLRKKRTLILNSSLLH